MATMLVFLGIFLLLIAVFREVLFPFLMAIYVAYLVEPVVAWTTRSRLLGLRWTRGPTIVVVFTLVVGGLALAGWFGISRLARTIRDASGSVATALKETGERAVIETADGQPIRYAVRVPEGTHVVFPHGRFRTMHELRLEPGAVQGRALLVEEARAQGVTPQDEATGSFGPGPEVRWADPRRQEPVRELVVRRGPEATGLEVQVQERLIGPIVRNLSKAGFDVDGAEVREFIELKADALKATLPEQLGRTTLVLAGKVALSVYTFFLILMLTAFIVMDRKTIASFFASLPPPKHHSAYQTLVRYVDDGLAGVIRGQLMICVVNGILTYLGLLLLGVPYAILLSTVAAVLSLIPIFGTIVSSIPIVLVALAEGLDVAVFALVWILLIHMVEANVLNPLIMGTHAEMHPVIIVFALLAGEHAFGVWGALLAVPTASILQSCFRFYLYEVEGIPKTPRKRHGEWLQRLWSRVRGRTTAPPAEPA
jgi:predicted PurR-regulated permease PerM